MKCGIKLPMKLYDYSFFIMSEVLFINVINKYMKIQYVFSPDEATCTCWMEPGVCFFEATAGVREGEVTGSGKGWRGRGSTSFTGCRGTYIHPQQG